MVAAAVAAAAGVAVGAEVAAAAAGWPSASAIWYSAPRHVAGAKMGPGRVQGVPIAAHRPARLARTTRRTSDALSRSRSRCVHNFRSHTHAPPVSSVPT